MTVTVNGKNLHGTVPAVTSKSMAHRLLICAALAEEPTTIGCSVLSEDIEATWHCLESAFADISYHDGAFTVTPHKKAATDTIAIDCGESGSTLRFLIPILCAQGVNADIALHGRLPDRPLSPLREELIRYGCTLSEQGSNPLSVRGKLQSGNFTLRGDVSSQFISGLLFALPLCKGDSTLTITGKLESASYVDMTLWALKAFGIIIQRTDTGYKIPGGQTYRSPGMIEAEGDWSAAAFWKVCEFLGAPVEVTGLQSDSLQGDKAICDILEKMRTEKNCKIDIANTPDLVLILSVAALGTPGETTICNAARVRLKESDRLATSAALIRTMGGTVQELEDGLIIQGGGALHGGTIDATGDHRIAMSAAIASVICGNVTIHGAQSASKSYPAFWKDFEMLGGSVKYQEERL